MNEHLLQQQLEDYQRGRLAPAEMIFVDDHLADCATCRKRVEAALQTTFVSLYADWQSAAEAHSIPNPAPHLTFEQIAARLDETPSDERQFIADHLATCAQCAEAAADLRAFKAEAALQPNRATPPPERAGRGWWSKVRALFRPLAPAPAFRLAFAALLLIVLAGWLIRLAFDKKASPPQIANQGEQPPVTPLITPSPEVAPLLAQLNDAGGQITLDHQGRLSGLDGAPPAYQQMIKDALTTQQLEKSPLLAGLVQLDSISMRGGDNQGNLFSVIKPVGKVMLSDRPTFQWSPLEGATGYIVEVYGAKFNLVARSSQGAGTSWMAPQSLKRGGIYSWQVKAIKGAEEFISPRSPAPQAKFRILDEARSNELARARRAYASSHLTLALLYAQAGLLDEAEQEFRALQKANPNSAISRRLLANLQAMRR